MLRSPSIVARPLGGGGTRGVALLSASCPARPAPTEWTSSSGPPTRCRFPSPSRAWSPSTTCPSSPRPDDFGVVDGFGRRTLAAASMRAARSVLACSPYPARDRGAVPRSPRPRRAFPLGADDDLPAAPGREAARAALGLTGPMILTVGLDPQPPPPPLAPSPGRGPASPPRAGPGRCMSSARTARGRSSISPAWWTRRAWPSASASMDSWRPRPRPALRRRRRGGVPVRLRRLRPATLEAMARGVPVVASRRSVAGRDLRRGRAARGASG